LARAGHGCWASSIDAQVLPSLSRLMKSGIGKGNVVEERLMQGQRTPWFLWQSWFISSLTMVCSWLGL
jgi:hypothetical protein